MRRKSRERRQGMKKSRKRGMGREWRRDRAGR